MHAELAAEAGLLHPAERRARAHGAVRVDRKDAGLDRACDPQVDDEGRLKGGYICDWWLIRQRPSTQTELKNSATVLFMDVYHAMTGRRA